MADYYPPVAFAFRVKFAGNNADVDASFQEVSGLESERDVSDIKEGGENRFQHRLPGLMKTRNLVLKRGLMVANSPLFDWCKETFEADFSKRIQPKDLTVSLLDQNQKAVMSWSVARSWPVKWTVESFNAQKNELAIESIEFAYQRLERKVERTLASTGMKEP